MIMGMEMNDEIYEIIKEQEVCYGQTSLQFQGLSAL